MSRSTRRGRLALTPFRSLNHVGPEAAKILDATGGGTEHRRVAHQQFSREGIRPRLQVSASEA